MFQFHSGSIKTAGRDATFIEWNKVSIPLWFD